MLAFHAVRDTIVGPELARASDCTLALENMSAADDRRILTLTRHTFDAALLQVWPGWH
jgi:hypothetical protein